MSGPPAVNLEKLDALAPHIDQQAHEVVALMTERPPFVEDAVMPDAQSADAPTPSIDQQAQEIAASMVDLLGALKASNPDDVASMPPKEPARGLLAHIGRHIPMATQDHPVPDVLEVKTCFLIARDWWPVPLKGKQPHGSNVYLKHRNAMRLKERQKETQESKVQKPKPKQKERKTRKTRKTQKASLQSAETDLWLSDDMRRLCIQPPTPTNSVSQPQGADTRSPRYGGLLGGMALTSRSRSNGDDSPGSDDLAIAPANVHMTAFIRTPQQDPRRYRELAPTRNTRPPCLPMKIDEVIGNPDWGRGPARYEAPPSFAIMKPAHIAYYNSGLPKELFAKNDDEEEEQLRRAIEASRREAFAPPPPGAKSKAKPNNVDSDVDIDSDFDDDDNVGFDGCPAPSDSDDEYVSFETIKDLFLRFAEKNKAASDPPRPLAAANTNEGNGVDNNTSNADAKAADKHHVSSSPSPPRDRGKRPLASARADGDAADEAQSAGPAAKKPRMGVGGDGRPPRLKFCDNEEQEKEDALFWKRCKKWIEKSGWGLEW